MWTYLQLSLWYPQPVSKRDVVAFSRVIPARAKEQDASYRFETVHRVASKHLFFIACFRTQGIFFSHCRHMWFAKGRWVNEDYRMPHPSYYHIHHLHATWPRFVVSGPYFRHWCASAAHIKHFSQREKPQSPTYSLGLLRGFSNRFHLRRCFDMRLRSRWSCWSLGSLDAPGQRGFQHDMWEWMGMVWDGHIWSAIPVNSDMDGWMNHNLHILMHTSPTNNTTQSSISQQGCSAPHPTWWRSQTAARLSAAQQASTGRGLQDTGWNHHWI